MTPSNNVSGMYNNSNQTEIGKCVPISFICEWTYSDQMKLKDFLNQLMLAEQIIYTFITIFTIFGNTLVLVATWRESSLHQPNKYFIACLAVADLLVGVFVTPLKLHERNLVLHGRSISVHLQRFIVWMSYFACTASIYTLTFISFDRYLKISKPLQYRSRMKTATSLKIISAIYIFSTSFATYAATPNSASEESQMTSKSKEVMSMAAIFVFLLPIMIMLAMYVLIFVYIHKRQKMLRNGELGQMSDNRIQKSAFRQDMKVIRMLSLVVGIFIFCWSGYFISWLLIHYYPNIIDYDNTSLSYWRRLYIILTATELLPLFNSLCNPIIYAWLDQTYRKAFKHLILRMILRKNDSSRQH